MLFTLEALRAKHGDACCSTTATATTRSFDRDRRRPTGVYKDALKPRLDELCKRAGRQADAAIDVLMVSHSTSDHVRGMLDLTERSGGETTAPVGE